MNNKNTKIEICPNFIRGGKCNRTEKPICGQQLKVNNELVCCSKLYYSMDLEKQLKRLKWYLEEIRNEELKSIDIEWDEYETQCTSTEYTNIITLVEEALNERPQEDCRYKEVLNANN